MAIFTVTARHPETGSLAKFTYNTGTSQLLDKEGKSVVETSPKVFTDAFKVSKSNPATKSKNIKKLKISLGLMCNYECEYCSQRFVERGDSTNPTDVSRFLDNLPNWFDGGSDGKGSGVEVEFWGGEPFVYWKTLKPLAESLKVLYPNIEFSVITNGSLLDEDKNKWLDSLGFGVSISHDANKQYIRGEDPLSDVNVKEAILDLYKRLHPKNKFSFNTMIHSKNQSRTDAYNFFKELTGNENISLGQGEFIDAYDAGGLSNSLTSDEAIEYRKLAINEIRTGETLRFGVPKLKVANFIETLVSQKPITAIGQKCGMDRKENIAVDLKGNVITCQNVSASATAPNGESHKVGSVDDFENIKLNTATHWSQRNECSECPVIHLCQGACMFLEGDLWEASCNNSFSDNIVYFSASFEILTGYIPVYIEGNQREDRKDIWGALNTQVKASAKKIIPIKAI